jgi:hypothetical protein
MAKKRLNADEAFQSIMGKNNPEKDENTNITNSKEKKNSSIETAKEKLLQTAFYITDKQRRALKIKTALGNKPEDKDQSSIVRAALDAYLADILDTL